MIRDIVFAASNYLIIFGYALAALVVAGIPRNAPTLCFYLRRRTRYHAILFFALCASTHFEMAIHTITKHPMLNLGTNEGPVDWHQLAIHVPQAYAILAFVVFAIQDGLNIVRIHHDLHNVGDGLR